VGAGDSTGFEELPSALRALPVRGLVAVAVLSALAGCGPDSTACPAIAWANTLTVQVAEQWTTAGGVEVRIACDTPCPPPPLAGEPAATTSVPLAGTQAVFHLLMSAPESVDVTVLGAAGAQLTTLQTSPDWQRVGGSAECGGPMVATVRVP
jgi:hypothetical protein